MLFVIGYDNASLPEIQSSLEKLDKSGTRVLGCVVNNVVSGRALGITPTADDHKKNISKKAAKKKEQEEKFGFEDENASGDLKAPETAAKTKRSKKEKRGRADHGKKEEPVAPAQGVPTLVKKRNIYEDSVQREVKETRPRNDQETMNELIRMGLNKDVNEGSAAEQPKDGAGQDRENPAPTE